VIDKLRIVPTMRQMFHPSKSFLDSSNLAPSSGYAMPAFAPIALN
jgi:hypothetical protein